MTKVKALLNARVSARVSVWTSQKPCLWHIKLPLTETEQLEYFKGLLHLKIEAFNSYVT